LIFNPTRYISGRHTYNRVPGKRTMTDRLSRHTARASLLLTRLGATYVRSVIQRRHETTGIRKNRNTRALGVIRAKGYLLYGPLGRCVRALRLLEQRQDLPESFLLRLPRHFHRVFQQHHRNAQPAFSDLADKRKLPTALFSPLPSLSISLPLPSNEAALVRAVIMRGVPRP